MRYLNIFMFICVFNFFLKSMDLENVNTKPNIVTKSKWESIFSLKTKDDTLIGTVFIKKINDTIFTELVVINNDDTIYHIDSTILKNYQGIDIEVGKNGFYGYKMILNKSDYFVINCLTNYGKNVSDDITIEWNYNKKLLEVQKVP